MKSHLIPVTLLLAAASAPAEDLASSFLAAAAAAPKIQAGKTTTLAAGKPAKVKSRVVGSTTYFDFSIPQGAKGSTGAAGPMGPAGPKGDQGEPADKHRSIYVAGNALAWAAGATGVTQVAHGLSLVNTATAAPEFTVPKPADWDTTTAISVTLYFAVATNSGSDTTGKWRLKAQSMGLEHTGVQSGWDSLDYATSEDASPLLIGQTGYPNVMHSQTWTAKWSNTYDTWYFGPSVSTGNDFVEGKLWKFGFARGYPLSNGESATNTFIITGATVDYQSK